MNEKEFIASFKVKTVKALLEALKLGLTRKEKIDPDILNAIIEELDSRELTDKERDELDSYLNINVEESYTKSEKASKEFSEDEMELLITDKNKNKYNALKMFSGLIFIFGFIVILVGIVLLIVFISEYKSVIGVISLVSSVIIALPLLAFSDLINVFIDIEYNTRKLLKKK